MQSKHSSLRQRLEALPTWALIVLCAIYCIVPEPIPFIDDIFVFGWTVGTIFKRLTMPCKSPLPAAHDVQAVDNASLAGTHPTSM